MMKIKQLLMVLVMGICLCGCVGINYTSTTVKDGITNSTCIKAERFIWSTENYNCIINTNGGGSLSATKSNVDAAAITAIGELMIKAMTTPK